MVIFIDAVTKITNSTGVWKYPDRETFYKALNCVKAEVSNKTVKQLAEQTENNNKYKNLTLKELLSIYEQRFIKK